LEMVQCLVESGRANVNLVDDLDGKTALHLSVASRSHLKITQCLIERGGANIDIKDKRGRTVLHYASSNSCIPLVRYLMERGAAGAMIDSVVDRDGMTPFHVASQGGCVGMMTFLVQACGANVNATYLGGKTALHQASQRGGLRLLTCLVQTCGTNVNAKDDDGVTALHYACKLNSIHIVQFLVESGGADIHVTDANGLTALHHACSSSGTIGCINKACLLIKAGANAAATNVHGCLVLHVASSRGRGLLNLVRLLVELYPCYWD
jgi:serine/threonine-protein phosphatase 6 regulatory ankyrin repeat subunit B